MPSVQFADENARIAWEVGQAISRISGELPPETPNLNARSVSFSPEYEAKGTYAIFFAGTVIGTDQKGVFVVPERSLTILHKLGIPYRAV